MKRRVNVLFYYSQHFNREDGSNNLFFHHLYDCCKRHNLSYMVFEEPCRSSNQKRNDSLIPFDFIYYLIVLLRKFGWTDKFIGKVVSLLFLRGLHFDNCIVLSQSMLEVLRGIDNNANIFDLQHGIIHSLSKSYIEDGKVNKTLIDNNIQLLLMGEMYKELLVRHDSEGYFKIYAHVIGLNSSSFLPSSGEIKKSVLVSLQFTEDHTVEQNHNLIQELDMFIDKYHDFDFYLRNHPRFNNEIDISVLVDKRNTKIAPFRLYDCFAICSFHLTSYSTTTFESANFGIPTIFLKCLQSDFNMFQKEYAYPLQSDLEDILLDYDSCSMAVKSWGSLYCSRFDEEKFISLLQ